MPMRPHEPPADQWIEEFCNYLYPWDRSLLKMDKAFALKQKHLPKAIFKYRTLDPQGYSLKNLEESTVWLSNPLKFNDPFDCAMTADIEAVINSQFVQNIPAEVIEKHRIPSEVLRKAKLSPNPLNVMIDWVVTTGESEINQSNAEAVKEALSKVIQRECDLFRDKLFAMHFEHAKICSFTTNPASLLMWGHYADQHKGFCIEYRTEGFDGVRDPRLRLLYPVIYTDQLSNSTRMFDMTSRKSFNNLAVQKALLTKSREWAYEKEWRLIIAGVLKDDQTWGFLPATAIHLGARISRDGEEKLLAIAERMNIDAFKMELSKREYALVPRQIR
jgi:hypothetical protein